jgi:hypothetical protein
MNMRRTRRVLTIGTIAALAVAIVVTFVRPFFQTAEGHQHEIVEMVAPYWRIGGGFASTIVLNNTRSRSVQVEVIVRTADGRIRPAEPIIVGGNSSADASLASLIPGLSGEGQIGLRYSGTPLEINAHLVVANMRQSVAFDHSFTTRNAASSLQMEGVFFLPGPAARAELALANTSANPVTVELTAGTERAERARPILIGPYEMEVVNLRALFAGIRPPAAARISIVHSGGPGDVLAQGMVSDPKGFSANIRLLDPSQLTTQKLFSALPSLSQRLNPIMLLNNTQAQEIGITVEGNYTMDGEVHRRVLYSVAVPGKQAMHVDLAPQIALFPEGATNRGLTIIPTGSQNGLMADLLLIGESGSQVLQVSPKGYPGDGHGTHSFPFRIGDGLETIITIANGNLT